ncbi:MAG: GNAT family N-acetyltransferase [Chloroflexi bacterium]|nr:GNAT family N-acetyltransferase [Chloroflexota bacterium]
MRVERFADVDAYLARVGPFLAAREPEHMLILGITSSIQAFPDIWEAPPYFSAVIADERVAMAAVRTPPWRLVLGEIDDVRLLEPLVGDLAADPAGRDVPGVMGPVPGVEAFASAWAARMDQRTVLSMSERAFKLERVLPVRRPPGSMRPAAEADRPLLAEWLLAFTAEASPDDPPQDPQPMIDRYLAGGVRGLRLWDDGGRVSSLAGFGGPTPNGIRVGPVYTPPELRGRGYARALVADLSAERLNEGRRFCFLFTDLANPTANRIYQEIGYEPVRDVAVWRFEAP